MFFRMMTFGDLFLTFITAISLGITIVSGVTFILVCRVMLKRTYRVSI